LSIWIAVESNFARGPCACAGFSRTSTLHRHRSVPRNQKAPGAPGTPATSHACCRTSSPPANLCPKVPLRGVKMPFCSMSTPRCRQTSGARLSRTARLPESIWGLFCRRRTRYQLQGAWMSNLNAWATAATNFPRLVTPGSTGQRRRQHAAACIRRSKRSFQGRNRNRTRVVDPPFLFTVPDRHDSIKARQMSPFRVHRGSYCVVRGHGDKERAREVLLRGAGSWGQRESERERERVVARARWQCSAESFFVKL
jgi:hypothetical protein